jgi:hypothetical protein
MNKKKSWRTTLLGAIAGIGVLIATTPGLKDTRIGEWSGVAAGISVLLGGREAADTEVLKDSAKKDDGPPPPPLPNTEE